MRMIGYLESPFECSKNQVAYKIMLDEEKDLGTYVYIYTDKDALFCSYDLYYEDLETALEEWSKELDSRGWIQIEDALPYCQHDCILPVRVKGRDMGKPQFGHFEILSEGEWIEYIPTEKNVYPQGTPQLMPYGLARSAR